MMTDKFGNKLEVGYDAIYIPYSQQYGKISICRVMDRRGKTQVRVRLLDENGDTENFKTVATSSLILDPKWAYEDGFENGFQEGLYTNP